ncbi:hypothetical protein [uncultured Bilophila sp.]|uniref:hypothetical protein n=1 Tax=uncultured Bilophila sp. TaxID=529385 RepID=UPI00266FC6AB|nr:hypothetical protein [uncultured Bilophila sp.]
MAVSSPQRGGNTAFFLQFSPWRNPWPRHFAGYSFGTSRKKALTIFYGAAYSLTPTNHFFRQGFPNCRKRARSRLAPFPGNFLPKRGKTSISRAGIGPYFQPSYTLDFFHTIVILL